MIFKKIIFLSFLILSLTSCSSVPENLSISKNKIIEYYESGNYKNDLNKIIENAKEKFDNVESCGSCAVVFDVDETALSNYQINKKLDFGYVPELWDVWIEEKKSRAIEPVKDFYDFLLNKNFKIIFITGRKDFQNEATVENLIKAGYEKFDTLITRSKSEYNLSALEFKSQKRIELKKMGYKIAGTVGDQFSDINGPEHGIQVKIPNYIYIIR